MRRYLLAAFIGATVYDWLLMYLRFRRDRRILGRRAQEIRDAVGGR